MAVVDSSASMSVTQKHRYFEVSLSFKTLHTVHPDLIAVGG